MYIEYELPYTYLHVLKCVVVTPQGWDKTPHAKSGSNVRTDDAIHVPRRYEEEILLTHEVSWEE